MGVIAFIGMGSNVGDRAATIGAAIDALDAVEGVAVLRTSALHETPPVGGPAGQGPYLNAAAKLETTLSPRDLLGVLQAIERDSGRVRAERWGERTLDLDLLLYSNEVIDEPGLVVPHPRMVVRRFVLAPLAEIWFGFYVADTGRSIGGLLFELDRRPGGVLLRGPDPDGAIAAGVVAGLDALDVTKEIISQEQVNLLESERDGWIVYTRRGIWAADAASEAFRGNRWHWLPNFSVTWGPEMSGVGRQTLRIRAPEGGAATDGWIVSEILAACAASRVPTRVVGSP